MAKKINRDEIWLERLRELHDAGVVQAMWKACNFCYQRRLPLPDWLGRALATFGDKHISALMQTDAITKQRGELLQAEARSLAWEETELLGLRGAARYRKLQELLPKAAGLTEENVKKSRASHARRRSWPAR
jgi:hypothetical protein